MEVTPAPSPIPSLHDQPPIVTPTPTVLKQPVPIQQNPTVALQFPNLQQYKHKPKPKKSKSKEKSSGTQGENTGRWTQEEHRLFLQGLEEHGKGWKKIASLIKSRTVVQIRTHAQKYFQKLAKARHNGEEGDVSMEGRGVVDIPPAAPVLAQPVVKRRRQVSGGKRKALSDVVESVQKEKKKDGRLPVVSPVLAPYVTAEEEQLTEVSSSALEDSLYRFLTPSATNFLPVTTTPEPYHSISPPPNETGVSITLPPKGVLSGEASPTGVVDVDKMPEFQSEIPNWFAKGSDVDELLNEAEALDWLADPGDLENYVPQEVPSMQPEQVADPLPESLPPVVSYNSISMNELPSLFDTEDTQPNKRLKLSSNNLFSINTEEPTPTEEFGVFDTSFDEQAFVSALLDSNDPTALLS